MVKTKSQTRYKREEHSLCCLDKYIVATGSFNQDLDEAFRRVELYDIAKDKWEEVAPLNHGRAMHSSCPFND